MPSRRIPPNPHCLQMPVFFLGKVRHQFPKPEPVSGFFTSARNASFGGASRICLIRALMAPVTAERDRWQAEA